jgi:FkbM family methyltransferase
MIVKDILNKETTRLNILSNSLLSNVPIIIFGTGNLGKKIVDFLIKEGKNVIAFSDNNKDKWDTEVLGVRVIAPSSMGEQLTESAIVIVAIWSPGHSNLETNKQLQLLGAKNVFSASMLMQLYPDALLPHYHFAPPQFFIDNEKHLQTVFDNLEDDESRKQYLAQLEYRFQADFACIPAADTKNQYFPSDVIKLGENEVFLDCGAYDGDTLVAFLKRTNNKLKKYIALEPDPENYKKLQARVSQYPEGQVEVFPYAVGDENCTLKFNATGGEGAGLSEFGSIEVECKTIDDKFYEYKPTFLKFDIEGAEQGALKGAERTIRDFKPVIAVCLYHLPNDIWAIPMLLKTYNNNYKFYVRTHAIDGFEFVLYAISE